MILKVRPTKIFHGSVFLPASKSYSIRAFLIAACGGVSRLFRPSDCDDALVAFNVARQLGSKIKENQQSVFTVSASKTFKKISKVHVGESGTVLRFVLPLLSLQDRRTTVVGKGTLIGRPNKHLLTSLRAQGVKIKGTGPKESVPIKISGGVLRGGDIHIDGSLSSQFISAFLIATAQLNENTILEITGEKIVSTDYIAMTIAVLKRAGIRIVKISDRCYKIPGKQKFKGLRNFALPSDYGLAAFLMAAAAILPSNIELKGYFDDSLLQADGNILGFYKKMGIKISSTSSALKMKGPFKLKGGTFSLKSCPDLVPIMAVLGLFSEKAIHLTDIGHARVKESDRISDLKTELLKVGAKVFETRNSLTVYPLKTFKANVILDPHRDHRLAMAFSVLGLKAGIRVKDIECTAKSYPKFVQDFKRLGAKISGL